MKLSKIFKILLPVLFMLISLNSGAQYLGTFKEIWLTNGDSTLNNQENGGIYYNETTDRFRFREDGVWKGLGGDGASSSGNQFDIQLSDGSGGFIHESVQPFDYNTTAGVKTLRVCCRTELGFSHDVTGTNSSALAGQNNVVSGNWGAAVGREDTVTGSYGFATGFQTFSGSFGHASGGNTKARGDYAFHHGRGGTGLGAVADRSAILGGQNHTIHSGNAGASIIGGVGIELTGTDYINFTAVDNFAIWSDPTRVDTTSTSHILLRNPTSNKIERGLELGELYGSFWNLTEDFSINPSTNNSLVVSGNNNDTLHFDNNLTYKFTANDGSYIRIGDRNLGGGMIVQSPRISGFQPDSTGIEFAVDQPANDGMLFYNRLTNSYSMGYNGGAGNMSLAFVNVQIPTSDYNAANKVYVDARFSGSLTDGTPTDAEIDAILGAPNIAKKQKYVVKDTDGSSNIYLITTDGTNWYYTEMSQAL